MIADSMARLQSLVDGAAPAAHRVDPADFPFGLLAHVSLRLSRGDALAYHAGTDCGPHVHITADDDEAIVRVLVAAGASVTVPRQRHEACGREWDCTDLATGDGFATWYVSTPHRSVPDLTAKLAETADRLAAGETLAEIAAKPLRSVP